MQPGGGDMLRILDELKFVVSDASIFSGTGDGTVLRAGLSYYLNILFALVLRDGVLLLSLVTSSLTLTSDVLFS